MQIGHFYSLSAVSQQLNITPSQVRKLMLDLSIPSAFTLDDVWHLDPEGLNRLREAIASAKNPTP